jgi:hemoglobin
MLDPDNSAHTQQSLYLRLGGYDVLAAFVSELMPRLRHDAKIGVYWKGKSFDGQHREDKLLVDFLGSAFGGPVFYPGRDMKTSHEGLAITEEEWDITLAHIAATLDTLGVAQPEKAEFLEAAESLKWDVVESSRPAAVG